MPDYVIGDGSTVTVKQAFRKSDVGLLSRPGRRFQKKVPIEAWRIEGPFAVETSEGHLICQDGWLCLDARGYPYPVADEEFQLIYEEIA